MTTPPTLAPAARRSAPRPMPVSPILAVDRHTTGGRFSLLADGPLRILAEAGTVVRVHTGCLWFPDRERQCSVAVLAGEQVTLRHEGALLVMGHQGVQMELVWPPRAPGRLH